MSYKVFVVDNAIVPHTTEVDVESEVLRDLATVELSYIASEADWTQIADCADGLILWHQVDATKDTIGRLVRTRVIVRNGVGFESVDVQAARERDIAVCNVPDYGTEEVADHALTLCLALNRQLKPLIDDVKQGNWNFATGRACRRVRGQVFGVIGCGRIGTAAALRAKAFGYDVRFYDPYRPSGYEKAIGLTRVETLEELVTNADVVSLHTPLTGETRHLIGEPQLRSMKRTAYLVNTARGPIVCFKSLEAALQQGWIAGAGLDVLEEEPVGAELATRFPNCIVTPHSAFYSEESVREMRYSSALTIREALVNGRYLNMVNELVPGEGRNGHSESGRGRAGVWEPSQRTTQNYQ